MPEIVIDGQVLHVPDGSTVLDACRVLKIEIPTLCHMEGLIRFTSCMLCLVEDLRTGQLHPSCSMPVHDKMKIRTCSDRITESRRMALELLFSEHLGDCEGPCERICPAGMNIPLMLRQLAGGDYAKAIATVKQHIALPAVLGRICPAPCEKGCRRVQIEGAVSICLLKRFAADHDLASPSPYQPECALPSGKTVAIAGSGPAGLSAAYYLLERGYRVVMFERDLRPGGMLCSAVSETVLPRAVLAAEIERIVRLGLDLRLGEAVGLGQPLTLENLTEHFDAVIVATGQWVDGDPGLGVAFTKRGIAVDGKTMQTDSRGVFAAGAAVTPTRMAVSSCGQGRDVALAVDRYFTVGCAAVPKRRFNSVLGKLKEEEKTSFSAKAARRGRVEPQSAVDGFTCDEARDEALRCLHCDCLKRNTCDLRHYADAYDIRRSRFWAAERRTATIDRSHPEVIVEPGKCIGCGRCVRIAAASKRSGPGLTFINRGIDVRVAVPFGESYASGLQDIAAECVASCPTASLALTDVL